VLQFVNPSAHPWTPGALPLLLLCESLLQFVVKADFNPETCAVCLPVAVFVVKVDPNYAQPWQKCPQRSSSGSAFVLDTEKRHIITNAHVVSEGRGKDRRGRSKRQYLSTASSGLKDQLCIH
jgi:hypothetical protein